MTNCSMCRKPMRGTMIGRVRTDFCGCFDNQVYEQKVKEPEVERSATEEELYAFNEGHRNELRAFLRKQSHEVRIHWLNWWKHQLELAIKGENLRQSDPANLDKVSENIQKENCEEKDKQIQFERLMKDKAWKKYKKLKDVNNINIYKEALEVFGKQFQIDMTFEESGEFISEFAKFLRGRSSNKDLSSEIVDLRIMLNQIVFMYNLDELVENEHAFKIKTLKERIIKKRKENKKNDA